FLQNEWPGLQDRWTTYCSGFNDDSVNNLISYTSLNGQHFTQPLWQLLLHIVNHATHHRGQASGFLRALGKAPQPLDLVAYYRQLGPWKS
ncbi:MAG: DinB family protein, partial [Bryobacterales bacterium]|nr:DinB family protein [Bryobacterales bacterium]